MLVIVLFGQKIARTLELVNWVIVGFILVTLLLVDLSIVPASKWWEGLRGFFTPALPPSGVDATLLGGLAGYTALASGLNWYNMNYYRDHGYGMGARVGFIAGLVGGRQEEVMASGVTFPDTPENARRWKRWFRLLLLDQWVVFFGGAILGMYLTTILVSHLASLPGVEPPTRATMPTYAADVLSRHYSSGLYVWALLVGFFILFTTQLGVFESLVRNVVDALYGTSPGFRRLIAGDPRRFYYPFMALLVVVISFLIFQALPTGLILISANMANLGVFVFPFLLMYLNSKLPGPDVLVVVRRPDPEYDLLRVLLPQLPLATDHRDGARQLLAGAVGQRTGRSSRPSGSPPCSSTTGGVSAAGIPPYGAAELPQPCGVMRVREPHRRPGAGSERARYECGPGDRSTGQ